MVRLVIRAVVGAMLAAVVVAGAAAQALPAASVSRLIVKLRAGDELAARTSTPADARTASRIERFRADAAGQGIALTHARAMAIGAQLMALPRRMPVAEAEAIAARLAQHPDVLLAQPDYRRRALRTPNDPRFASQWYLANTPYAIHAPEAWDATIGSAAVVVAVVDTGVRAHADLAGRLLPGYDFVADPKVANDGDGRDSDATDPGDWVEAADLADPDFAECDIGESTWHGTGVAGIVGANSDNGRDVAGIDWSAKILPVRVLGKCGGYDSDILDGMAWAAGLAVPGVPANPHPAQVINLSLGGAGACPDAYAQVIDAALAHGVTRAIVVAAGNEHADVSTAAPANCVRVVAVAASTSVGALASYSNFGSGITVAAPGGSGPTLSRTGIAVLSNTGGTAPAADDVAYVDGTSAAAPMVSAVAALVLSLAPNLTAIELRNLLASAVSPFSALSECVPAICGPGIINARSAVLAAQSPAGGQNFQGIWWNAPANSESGWGINFAHQGDTIFASWFTYDTTGRGVWLVMTAPKTGPDTYSGTLYQTRGPPFSAQPFDPNAVTSTAVGTGTLTFADANNGTFRYALTSPAVTQTKNITRQVFGPLPTCVFASQPNLALATNYQDLWWAAPAASESGWGINLNHEGDTLFATWYTYDVDGSPMWLVATAPKTGPGMYAGDLYRTSGARFDAFDPAKVVPVRVGTATFVFADGNRATFSYAITGVGPTPVTQSKTIVREVFVAPGTTCR